MRDSMKTADPAGKHEFHFRLLRLGRQGSAGSGSDLSVAASHRAGNARRDPVKQIEPALFAAKSRLHTPGSSGSFPERGENRLPRSRF